MSRRFVTIFPICEDVHLVKDIGQIPYFLHRQYGYDAAVVTYRMSGQYNNLETEVHGLKLEFIEDKGKLSFLEKGIVEYLRHHAKNIDVLNLYHYTKQSFAYGLLYKKLNPAGKLFIKVDGYNDAFKTGKKVRHSQKPLKNFLLGKLEKACVSKADLLTMENTEGVKLLQDMYPEYKEKIIYLPVGVNDVYLDSQFKGRIRSFDTKENIILTTGRIGLDIKNHEMILRALCQVDMKDWKMVFVGPLYSDLRSKFEELAGTYPSIKGRVEFTGEITDRTELYEWYNRAKVFLMTSHRESFSVSIAEAVYFGNYVIGTDGVMSMKDITDQQRLGKIIAGNDDQALALELQKVINEPDRLRALMPEIMKRSREIFSWSKIIATLNFELNR